MAGLFLWFGVMAVVLESLLLKLEADTSRLRSELQRADQTVDKRARRIDSHLKRLDKGFARLKKYVIGLGTAFLTFQAGRFISESVKAGDHIQKTALRLQMSTEALSQYSHVMQIGGVDLEKFIKSQRSLQKAMGDALDGLSSQKRAFSQLNLDVKAFSTLAPEKQFLVLTEALNGVENPAKRTQIAMALMGRAGSDMLSVMNMGVPAIRSLMMEADALGKTLTQVEADNIANFNDSLTRFSARWEGAWQSLTADMGPVLTSFIDRFGSGLQKLFEFVGGLFRETTVNLTRVWVVATSAAEIAGERISDYVTDMMDAINLRWDIVKAHAGAAWDGIGRAIRAVLSVIKVDFGYFVGWMGDVFRRLGAVKDAALSGNAASARTALDELQGTISGFRLPGGSFGKALSGAFDDAVRESDLPQLLTQLGQEGGGAAGTAFVDELARRMTEKVQGSAELQRLLGFTTNTNHPLPSVDPFERTFAAGSGAADGVKDQFKDAFKKITDTSKSAAEKVKGTWAGAAESIQGAFATALDGILNGGFGAGLRGLGNELVGILTQAGSNTLVQSLAGGVTGGGSFDFSSLPSLITKGITDSPLGGIGTGLGEWLATSSLGQVLGLSAATGPAAGSFAAAQQIFTGYATGGGMALTGAGAAFASAMSWIAPVAAIAIPMILSQIDNGPRNVYARRYLTTDANGNLAADAGREFNWKNQAGADVFTALDAVTSGFLDITGQIESRYGLGLDRRRIVGTNTQGSAGVNAGAFFAYFNDQEGQEGWVSLFAKAGDALYATAQEALDAAVRDVISGGFLQSDNAAINKALSGAVDAGYFADKTGQEALTVLDGVMSFVDNFADSVTVIAEGGLDFSRAVGVQARQNIDQTREALESFIQTTTDLGLDVAAAQTAAADHMRVFLGLAESPPALTPWQAAARSIEATHDALIEALPRLEQFGVTLDMIAEGMAAQMARLADSINQENRLALWELTNPAAAAAAEWAGQASAILTDTFEVGGDMSLALQRVMAEQEAVANQFIETADATENLTDTLGRFQNVLEGMRNLRASLLVDNALSPLTAMGRYDEARSQLAELDRLARVGNVDAAEKIDGAIREFLSESRAFNASNEAYASDFSWALQIAERTESVAERQVSLLTQQVSAAERAAYTLEDIRALLADAGAAAGLVTRPNGQVTTQALLDQYRSGIRAITGYDGVFGTGEYAQWRRDNPAFVASVQDRLTALTNRFGFAEGGSFGGGLRLVGERGPELEVTGPSRIFSTEQTQRMLSGSQGPMLVEIRGLRSDLRQYTEVTRSGAVANVNQGTKIEKRLVSLEASLRRVNQFVMTGT